MTAPGTWRPSPHHSGPRPRTLGLVLHVQEGNGSPYGEFTGNTPASYHWWVAKDGKIERYVDPAMVAWAQAAGNQEYLSVGTEGFTTEALTPEQLQSLSLILQYCAAAFNFPVQLAEAPGDEGFGWHGMGCKFNWGHCVCPGPIRREQRQAVLDLLKGGQDDMFTDDDRKKMMEIYVTLQGSDPSGPDGTLPPHFIWVDTLKRVAAMEADIASIKAKVGA